MQLDHPFGTWPQMRQIVPPETAQPRLLDWAGIRARLIAARELNRAEANGDLAECGSFHRSAADALTILSNCKDQINPTDLAHGKALVGTTGEENNVANADERGQE